MLYSSFLQEAEIVTSLKILALTIIVDSSNPTEAIEHYFEPRPEISSSDRFISPTRGRLLAASCPV
jgi:hypothetical protein